MNETTRTLTFVGVAALFAVAAFAMHRANTPVSLDEFSDVGTEFYPDFKDPNEATGLRVAAYNKDAARVDVFDVEFKDGLWRIPSHYDYPADGKDRLAKTATSIIGLKREALVSTSADDHKRLGVLDPLDETITGTEGRGDRITLTRNDSTLADFIIGNKIEDGPANTYNVRRADENRTYRVTLNLDISTRFADWIEPDLLEVRRPDIRELVIDRYSVDETRGVIVQGIKSDLTRASADADWTLKDIDAATQKVKVSTVNQMINALVDLKIVGVRPKPPGLSADLKQGSIVAEDGSVSASAFRDLQKRGFFLLGDGSLKSNEGEIDVALADGVKYILGFGEVFTGTDVEIEVGKSAGADDKSTASADDKGSSETNEPKATDEADTKKEADADAEDAESESADGATAKKSRYLFVLTQFDESMIAPLPDKPIKPEQPATAPAAEAPAEKDADADKDAANADAASADKSEEKTEPAATESKPEATDDAAKTDEKPADDAAAKADEEYKQALADYDVKLKDWEARKKEREEKIEAGKKRVKELNDRFADWYYVISAETFDKIRVSPEALVEPVTPKESPAGNAPQSPSPLAPPATAAPPAETQPAAKPEKPDSDAPPAEPAKPATGEATPAADKPAEPGSEAPAKSESVPAAESPKPVDSPADEPASTDDDADK